MTIMSTRKVRQNILEQRKLISFVLSHTTRLSKSVKFTINDCMEIMERISSIGVFKEKYCIFVHSVMEYSHFISPS